MQDSKQSCRPQCCWGTLDICIVLVIATASWHFASNPVLLISQSGEFRNRHLKQNSRNIFLLPFDSIPLYSNFSCFYAFHIRFLGLIAEIVTTFMILLAYIFYISSIELRVTPETSRKSFTQVNHRHNMTKKPKPYEKNNLTAKLTS